MTAPVSEHVNGLKANFVASVAERDIDFVVLEELIVSPEFAEFFTSRVFERPIFDQSIDAWHSLTTEGLGESDLVFLFQSLESQTVALLIENKIDAVAQPTQDLRYRQRGELGRDKGHWGDFRTVVIAPRRYLLSAKYEGNYDAQIPYEELLSYFLSRRSVDRRFAYKARVIQEGIEQNRRGYQATISKEMTEFVRQYCEFCKRKAPELNVETAKPRPAGSTWMMFHPPGLMAEVSLVHQLTRGTVKLIWAGRASEEAAWRTTWQSRMSAGVILEPAGKSMSMTMEVPVIDPTGKSFEAQKDLVGNAVAAARTLLRDVGLLSSGSLMTSK